MVKLLFIRLTERMLKLPRIFVIARDNQQYRAVYARMLAKQDGCCSYCSAVINENDTIVSKAYARKSKYFHKACAEMLHIL